MAGRRPSQRRRHTDAVLFASGSLARGARGAAGLVPCAAALLIAGPVQAATVGVVDTGPMDPTFDHRLAYTAAPGETNRVTARLTVVNFGPSRWTISDTGGAVLTPGEGCETVDAHTVSCSSPSALIVELGDRDDALRFVVEQPIETFRLHTIVNAGDGNDVVVIGTPGISARLDGDAGDDRLIAPERANVDGGSNLEGGPGNDFLLGSNEIDDLDGGGGIDEINGRAGNDYLADGDRDNAGADIAPGPDVLIGGTGTDMLDFSARTAPVSVDLAHPVRRSSEGDHITEIENVRGGRGGDRLAGDDGPNHLWGEGGRDRLIGRGGDDDFYLHDFSANVVGPGDSAAASCGPGRDRLAAGVVRRDFIDPDCELIHEPASIYPVIAPYPETARADSLRYRLSCPQINDGEGSGEYYDGRFIPAACSGVIRVREAARRGRVLATGRFPRGEWSKRLVAIGTTDLGRRLASRSRGVRATVLLKMRAPRAGDFDPHRLIWTIRLKIVE